MTAMTTGRIAIDEAGEIYQLGFVPEPTAEAPVAGLIMAQVTTGAPAATQASGTAAYLGEAQTLADGTPLPAGIWEVEGGTVYAGSGGATIRQVVFE